MKIAVRYGYKDDSVFVGGYDGRITTHRITGRSSKERVGKDGRMEERMEQEEHKPG